MHDQTIMIMPLNKIYKKNMHKENLNWNKHTWVTNFTWLKLKEQVRFLLSQSLETSANMCIMTMCSLNIKIYNRWDFLVSVLKVICKHVDNDVFLKHKNIYNFQHNQGPLNKMNMDITPQNIFVCVCKAYINLFTNMYSVWLIKLIVHPHRTKRNIFNWYT